VNVTLNNEHLNGLARSDSKTNIDGGVNGLAEVDLAVGANEAN